MRFRELYVEGFGCLSARRFEFAEGASVLVGNNEAGKSTLVCALAAALFGLDRRRALDRDVYALYRPRNEQLPFGVSVVVEDEDTGTRYRIERDLLAGSCSAARMEPGGSSVPVPNPSELVTRLMGISSLSLFKSTVFITHADMVNVDEGKPAKAISERATGTDVDASVAEAVERLRRRLGESTRKGQSPDRQGEIQRAEEAVRESEEALRRIDDNMAEHERLKALLENQEKRLREARQVVEECGPVVERWQRFDKAKERLEEARKKLDAAVGRLLKIREEQASLDRLSAALDPYEPVKDGLSDDAAKAVGASEKALAAARGALEQCEASRQEVDRRMGEVRSQRSQAEESLKDLQKHALTPETLARLALVRKTIEERKAEAEGLRERSRELEELAVRARVRRSGATTGLVLCALGLILSFLMRGATSRPLPMTLAAGLGRWVGLTAALAAALVGLGLFAIELVRWQRLERKVGEMEEVRRRLEKVRADVDSLERERDFVEMGRCYDDLVAASSEIGSARTEAENLAGMEKALAGQLERYAASLADYRAQAESAGHELEGLLSAAGCASAAEYREKRDKFLDLMRQGRLVEARLAMLLDRRQAAEWEADVAALTGERLTREREMEEAGAAVGGTGLELDPVVVEKYRARLDAAKQEDEAARMEIAAAASRLEAHRIHAMGGDRHDAAEALLAARDALQRRLLERDALLAAIEALQKAYASVDRTLAPLMQRRALEVFGTITAGRYSDVEVEVAADDLRIHVKDPDSGQSVDPVGLSTGTREQLYLAMRIALAEYLTGGRRFPMVMDDPLVSFDPERLRRTLDVLAELSKSHQLILVTIHSELGAELAARVGDRARIMNLAA